MTGEARYLRVEFADLPGWARDDHLAAFLAFRESAKVRLDASLTQASERALALDLACMSAADARGFFEAHFRPYRFVQHATAGLLTGYYEPVIAGSLVSTHEFAVPIYYRPPDLENVVAESERGAKSAGLTHVRRTAAGTAPYATRREIEEGALSGLGLELCYLGDPVDAFFLHVQGSGAIRLPGGETVRITYDGKNGHPYTSVGRAMIDAGYFSPDDLTLQTMGEWLRADPARARLMLWKNESFVFFRKLDGDHPVGVLGTALHPGRSLAVDTAYHTLGLPIYVSAPSMTHVAPSGFNRLMVAHDVGSAIKGLERGDIYFGNGEAALALAGVTKHPGTFHVLLPEAPP